MRNPFPDPGIGALQRERAHVQLVDDGFAPRPAGPGVVAPAVGLRVDHFARPVDVARLEARRRIGHEQLAVDPVLVQGAGAGLPLDMLEPAVFAFRRKTLPGKDKIDILRPGRPQPKADTAGRQHFGAERHDVPAGYPFLRGHQRSSISAAQSLPPSPKASARANTTPARTMR